MGNPKVSIIVPIYNVEKYLDRCMNSLVNQALKDIEIIMVDDGSPDNCPKMCDEWAKKDSRIKVIHKKNGGLGYARNSGLDVATGEYVAFVDSDDYVEASMYEVLYNTAKNNQCNAVFSGFYQDYYTEVSEKREVTKYTEFGRDVMGNLAIDFIAAPPYCKNEYVHEMSVWHSVYLRDTIEENSIRFVSERIYASEDVPFQIDFLKMSDKIAFIPDCFYHYCYNEGSLTKQFNLKKYDAICKLFYLLRDKTKELDPKALRPKRLFIGYSRTAMRQIASSKSENKLYIIKEICQNNIWNDINDYNCRYLPLHSAVMFYFIKHKLYHLILLMAKIMNANYLKSLKRAIGLVLYYGIAQYLPDSYIGGGGRISNRLRIFCAKLIFKKCGKISAINRRAYFGNGSEIEMGDYSSIGANSILPNNIKIGKYVMMAPEVHIISDNHNFDNIDIPMCMQGSNKNHPFPIIEDDCWIGVRAILTVGRHVRRGSIVAAGAVLTKDFPDFSVVGGNPAKLIKSRKTNNN